MPISLACAGPQPLALQQQLHQRVRRCRASAPCARRRRRRAAARAGPPGSRAATFGSSTTIAVVAGERDLEAAAERGAVDRRDDRLAERLQPPQLRLAVAHALRRTRRMCSRAAALEVVEVAAGEEGLLGGGDDHAGDLVLLGLEPVDGRRHRRHVGGVHRVGRLVGVVERQDDDAVGVLLPADRVAVALPCPRFAQDSRPPTRSITVAMPMPPPMHSVARP